MEENHVHVNFKVYKNEEEKLDAEWKSMEALDKRTVVLLGEDDKELGMVTRTNERDVQGDNYLLSIGGEARIRAHKEVSGWSLFEFTSTGPYSMVPIDNDTVRAKKLKNIFFQVRRHLELGGKKGRSGIPYSTMREKPMTK